MKLSQKQWERWFVISCILVCIALVIGILPNSRIDYPNWYIYSAFILINFLVSMSIGTNPKYNKDE